MNLIDWEKGRLLLLAAGLQLISFASGIYSGHTYWPKHQMEAVELNYTTAPQLEAIHNNNPTNTSSSSTNNKNCPIKGNVSGKNKIYHVQGGAFYDRTQEEMCFQNEAEAAAAGFVKSSR